MGIGYGVGGGIDFGLGFDFCGWVRGLIGVILGWGCGWVWVTVLVAD